MERTKYLSDDWMITRGFMEIEEAKSDLWWIGVPISELQKIKKSIDLNVLTENLTLSDALALMNANSVDLLINFQEKYNFLQINIP